MAESTDNLHESLVIRQTRVEENLKALTKSFDEFKTAFTLQAERARVDFQNAARDNRVEWSSAIQDKFDRVVLMLKEQQERDAKDRAEKDKENKANGEKIKYIWIAVTVIGTLLLFGDKVLSILKALNKP